MPNEENRKKLIDTLKKSSKVDKIVSMAQEGFRYSPTERVSSGELGLDIALGGGYPKGRMIKISGKYSYGKTIILANSMRSFTNELKHPVLMIDPDGTTTGEWLKAQGIDVDYVDYNCPETMENALDLVEAAITSNAYGAVYLDSLAALTPDKELESSVSDFTQGLKARKINQFFRKLRGRYSKFIMSGDADIPTFFYTNHVFTDLNKKFDKDVTPGGQEQDNAATIIIKLGRGENIWVGSDSTPEDQRDYVGWYVQAKVVKNKVSPPFQSTTFAILNKQYCGHPSYSFYHADTLARFAIKIGAIVKGGAWYEVKGFGKYQGMENLTSAIAADSAMGESLAESVKSLVPFKVKYTYPDLSMFSEEPDVIDTAMSGSDEIPEDDSDKSSKRGRPKKDAAA